MPDESTPLRAAQQQADEMWRADEASRGLGMELGPVGPGRARVTMTVRPDMVNGHGICHGGYLFLLADTAFAFACNTYGPAVVAAGADVTFLRPARLGERLEAVAVERARTGRSGLYDVTVRRGDEAIVEFRGRSRAVPGATAAPSP